MRARVVRARAAHARAIIPPFFTRAFSPSPMLYVGIIVQAHARRKRNVLFDQELCI